MDYEVELQRFFDEKTIEEVLNEDFEERCKTFSNLWHELVKK